MRKLILPCLGLALGCLVAPALSEEVQWRSAKPAGNNSPPVTLARPEPLPAGAPSRLDSAVRPVSFTPAAESLQPVFRGKSQEVLRPLPTGAPVPPPPPGTQAVEVAPLPAPLPGNGGPVPRLQPTPTQTWTGPIPQGVGGPTIVQHGPEIVDGCAGGACCAPGDCCGLTCCDPCGGCRSWNNVFHNDGCCCEGGVPHLWARAEYLLWSIRSPSLPPLVTVDRNFRGGAAPPGYLTTDTAEIAFGGNNLDLGGFSGGRFTVGVGGRDRELGFEATMFFLGERTTNFFLASDPTGFPGIGIPFFSPDLGINDVVITATPFTPGVPGVVGSVNIDYVSRLWGLEGNVRKPWYCEDGCRIDLLAGFRYINLTESLVQTEVAALQVNTGAGFGRSPYLPGDRVKIIDSFGTINHFYGGQVGAEVEYRHDRWILGATAKLGLGNMHQVVNISGATTFTRPGVLTASSDSGIRALVGTNVGHFSRDRLCFAPELGLKVGYQLTDSLNVFVGYDVLFLSSVVRAGEQIDPQITGARLSPDITFGATPGTPNPPARPAVLFKSSSFWAQGVTAGIEWKY